MLFQKRRYSSIHYSDFKLLLCKENFWIWYDVGKIVKNYHQKTWKYCHLHNWVIFQPKQKMAQIRLILTATSHPNGIWPILNVILRLRYFPYQQKLAQILVIMILNQPMKGSHEKKVFIYHLFDASNNGANKTAKITSIISHNCYAMETTG